MVEVFCRKRVVTYLLTTFFIYVTDIPDQSNLIEVEIWQSLD